MMAEQAPNDARTNEALIPMGYGSPADVFGSGPIWR